MARDLLAELKAPPSLPTAPSSSNERCAMRLLLNCCHGRGYALNLSGPIVQASLCPCVQSCQSCQGRAQILTADGAAACHHPSPIRIINAINAAAIPSRYGMAKMRAFSNLTGNGKELVAKLNNWLKTYNRETSPGIIISGPTGVGKTYLLCAMGMALATRGYRVRFIDFFQLLSELRAGYSANKSEEETLKPLSRVDLLIIDELGKGRHNDFELAIIDQLVMGRYNQRKPILASTNYLLKPPANLPRERKGELDGSFELNDYSQLETRIGKRTFSRLVESSEMLELSGSDFRRLGKE